MTLDPLVQVVTLFIANRGAGKDDPEFAGVPNCHFVKNTAKLPGIFKQIFAAAIAKDLLQ